MGKLLRYSGTVIVPAERISALEAIKHEALGLAGGYTATPAEGGWVAARGAVSVQPVVAVKVWAEDDAVIRRWVVAAITTLKGYGEEAVMFESTVSGEEASAGIVQ